MRRTTTRTTALAMLALVLLAAFALVAPTPVVIADSQNCEQKCGGPFNFACTLECRMLQGPGGEHTPEFLECFNACLIRLRACKEACENAGGN